MSKKQLAYITSAFFRSPQTEETAALFSASARARGLEPLRLTNAEIAARLDGRVSTRRLTAALFFDKDLVAARALEATGCRLFNRAEAIALADDKALTALSLARAGVPAVPTYCVPMTYANIGYTETGFVDELVAFCGGFPLVVKHRRGSLGAGVFLVENARALLELLRGTTTDLVAQPFRRQFPDGHGCDLRLNVVGGRLNNAIRRENKADFRSNLAAAGTAGAVVPPAEAVECALAGARALGLDFAGCDLLRGPRGWEICEINSNALTVGAYRATGVNAFDAIIDYVKEQMSWT
ncbi:MAG: hypothetical protein KIG36_04180 [Eubacteriales bacterium]|nr:hypothetical protein [Eubacteriales bacterium]